MKGISSIRKASLTSRNLAKKIADLAYGVKAEDIVLLDMRNIVNFCDYFIICSGTSVTHVKAIANGIDRGLDEAGIEHNAAPRSKEASWLLFDLGDVVVHIFHGESREFYNLEYLWREAKQVAYKPS